MRVIQWAGMSLGCAALSVVAGCNAVSPPAPNAQAVTAEVKAAIRSQVDAYGSRDLAKAVSILAPDVRTFFHGEPDRIGKAAAEASIKTQLDLPSVNLEVSDETVDVAASGDLAVYHAKYRFSFKNPETNQPVVEVGNWVAIFKRQADGVMRLSTDIVADNPSPTNALP